MGGGYAFKIDKLLIEAKASGISAADELRNRYGTHGWAIQTCPVKGDKLARVLAIQPMFSQGHDLRANRDWPQMVIYEIEMFLANVVKHPDATNSWGRAGTLSLGNLCHCARSWG
jgi:phage terminase large subunit-like protein